ncbi:hypothetical protein [Kitasatospora aureofaciens]
MDSYIDQGAGAWRIYWTWGPADGDAQKRGGHNDVVVAVLLIGPHR